MQYQLTPVPFCLGSSEGFFNKTNKASGFNFLVKDLDDEPQLDPSNTVTILDGNCLFHTVTELPDTFKGVAEKIFSLIPSSCDVIFSTDTYCENSIKSSERRRRGTGEKFLIQGPNMKRPPDWKGFLSNDDNKEMLADVILQVWSDDKFGEKLQNRKVRLLIKICFIYSISF